MIELLGGLIVLAVIVLAAKTGYDYGYQAGHQDGLELAPSLERTLGDIRRVLNEVEPPHAKP